MYFLVVTATHIYRYKGRECVNIAEVEQPYTAEELELFRVYGFGDD